MDKKLIEKPGIVVIDKPRGPTSHQVTAWAGEILGSQVGHSGTLDPQVSGVLVVMLGNAVRLAPLLLKEEKEYVALLRLHGDVPAEKVHEAAALFTGRTYQRPPRRSAVARNLRIRTIHSLDILDIDDRLVLIKVHCEAGTYIRSLCHHMGLALGVGGHMQELRRTRSGRLTEADAHTLHDLRDAAELAAAGDRGPLEKMVLPVESVAIHLPTVVIRDTAVDALCHGARLAAAGIISCTPFEKRAEVAVMTRNDELLCLGSALVSSKSLTPGAHGLVVAPHTVFMQPGTYPRGWKKRDHSQNKEIKS